MLRHIRSPDRGTSFTEYAAVILLVAAITAVVLAGGIPGTIRDNIQAAIESIGDGEGSDTDSDPQEPNGDNSLPEEPDLPESEEIQPADREPEEDTAWPYTVQPAIHEDSDSDEDSESDSEAPSGEVDPEDSRCTKSRENIRKWTTTTSPRRTSRASATATNHCADGRWRTPT